MLQQLGSCQGQLFSMEKPDYMDLVKSSAIKPCKSVLVPINLDPDSIFYNQALAEKPHQIIYVPGY